VPDQSYILRPCLHWRKRKSSRAKQHMWFKTCTRAQN